MQKILLLVSIPLPHFFISNCWQHQFHHCHNKAFTAITTTNIILSLCQCLCCCWCCCSCCCCCVLRSRPHFQVLLVIWSNILFYKMPQDENKNKTNRGDTQKNPKRPKNNGNFITINNDVLDRFCHFSLIDSLKWSIFFDLIYWDNCIIKMLKCIAIDIWIPSIDERTCTQFFLSSDFIDSFSIRRTFALCSVSRQHFHRWILVFRKQLKLPIIRVFIFFFCFQWN